MSVRTAKFGDIPRLVELYQMMHARSVYVGRDEVDEKETKRLLFSAIQKHGAQGVGATAVWVAERRGNVEGFIVGMTDRVCHIGKKLMASDVHFWGTRHAGARSMFGLFNEFEKWAMANPNVIEIKPGLQDIAGDYAQTAKFYERKGYRKIGVIYQRSIER